MLLSAGGSIAGGLVMWCCCDGTKAAAELFGNCLERRFELSIACLG